MFQLTAPPEMTTAITDGLLGILAFFLAYRLKDAVMLRTRIWKYVFAGIGLSGILGVPAHAFHQIAGLNPPNLQAQTYYWAFLGFSLFLMASLLAVAVLYDISGESFLKRNIKIVTVLGLLFYTLYLVVAVFQIIAEYFIVFVGYSAIIMLFALISYFVMALRRRNSSMFIIVAAILAAIFANLVQASGAVSFTAIWKFDSNSVYHFIMMISLLLFYRGVAVSRGLLLPRLLSQYRLPTARGNIALERLHLAVDPVDVVLRDQPDAGFGERQADRFP